MSDITPRTAGTVVFGGRRSLSYRVEVSLVNERNKTIGNGSITLTTGRINFSAGDRRITPPDSVFDVVNFRNIKVEDLTPTLTIVIRAVNGISSRELNASGYMKIDTGDLEQRQSVDSLNNQRRSNNNIGNNDPAKFWSVGISLGTSFSAPWAIGTVRATIAPWRYSFLELGFDYGMVSGNADAEFYYSLYPYAHYNLFLPFTQSGGWYAGAGGGFMLAEYTFPDEKIKINTFALDVTTGINLWNMLDIAYTLRTNFKSASNKFSVGYTYRFN